MTTYGISVWLLLTNCLLYALCALLVLSFKTKKYRISRVLLMLALLVFYVALEMRVNVLSVFLIAALTRHYLGSPSAVRVIVACTLALALFFPSMLVWRHAKHLEDLDTELARVYGSAERLYGSTIGSHHQGIVPLVAIVSATAAGQDFEYGRTMWNAVLTGVPRQLWRDKPATFPMRFTDTIFNNFFQRERTIISPTLLGEGWANFGFSGMCGIALLSGLYWSSLHRYCVGRDRGNISGIFIYAACFPVRLDYWESSFVSVYQFAAPLITTLLVSASIGLRGQRQQKSLERRRAQGRCPPIPLLAGHK